MGLDKAEGNYWKLETCKEIEGNCFFHLNEVAGSERNVNTHMEGEGGREKVTTGTRCLLCPFQFKSYKF